MALPAADQRFEGRVSDPAFFISRAELAGMQKMSKETLFKPSRGEVKGDATTRAAREIIDRERAERDAKTERLRTARLAKEAADEEAARLAPPPAPRRAAAKSPAKSTTKTAAKAKQSA